MPSPPSSARDLQAKIQAKIDEEHARPPEPIEVTTENNDPHYMATCAVLNGSTRTTGRRHDGGLSSSKSSKNEMRNSLDPNPNSSRAQQSLEDTRISVCRTPEERLRDKILEGSSALEESKNDSADANEHGLHVQSCDNRRGEEEHHHQQHEQEQQDQHEQQRRNRHYRPSQVEEVLAFAGNAATSGSLPIGVRRTPAVSLSSKTDAFARDERVGAFFVQSSLGTDNNDNGPTLDSLGLTEEEQRWISLESGHPLSSSASGIGTGLQALAEEEHVPSPRPPPQEDNKNKDLVCGMKKHVFVGVVVAFAVLTVAIIATAIGASTPSKPSSSPAPSPPSDMPHSPEPEAKCKNGIAELPSLRLDGSDDGFGSSVGISRNNAVAGATGCDGCRGAAFVYERSGDEDWVQIAELFPSESFLGDSFGKSIDIDGDIIVVGGNCIVEIGYEMFRAGCVHVFVRTDGNRWTQEATLVGDDEVSIPEVSFASSLAIDGGVLVVGEPSGDFQERGQQSGFIYIYERQDDGTWVEEAKVRPSDAQDRDQFGSSLDIDEDQVVVGAPRRHSGGAYVFSKQLDGTWLERVKLVPDDASRGDSFGKSVSITQYGRIAVGATGDDDNGFSSGSVYVFEDVGGSGSWTETAKLIPDDGLPSDRFGSSVAIFGDTILVGAIGVDGHGENSGAVYSFSFDRSESSWQQTTKIVAPIGGKKEEFGIDIAVYGTKALVASFYNAPNLLDGGLNRGKVYALNLLC